jgi:hypothetical protein
MKKTTSSLSALLIGCFCLFNAGSLFAQDQERCVYSTWEWNTATRKSENHRRVDKLYSDVTGDERDPNSQCTVCERDQTWIRIDGLRAFRMCQHFADRVRSALQEALARGFRIKTISAYRVGRSRGPLDANNRRTGFSNHSFGTAIDINSHHNGLYGNCVKFSPSCALRRGGEWHPASPLSVTRDSPPYSAMSRAGFKWGGEIRGRQKDFMHFSLTGY